MLANGRHTLGPETGTLQVRTSREGAYARAGHDLVMEVERWEGVLDVDDDAVSLEITCDARSLRVRWGFNGTTSLSDKDRADIGKTIDTKVLQGAAIRFRSTGVRRVAEKLRIAGELTIGTTTRRIEFDLRTNEDGSRADATASVRQTSFGIKPYSAMLATLKVGDDVEITARATLPRWVPPVIAEPPQDERSKLVEPTPVVESIEPRQPVLAAHAEPTAPADAIESPVAVAAAFAAPAPPAPEIEPWQPVARHYFAPKPAADASEEHAPAEDEAPAPAADAMWPWQPVPTRHSAPAPVADPIEPVEPVEPPAPVAHATPTPATDAIEPLEHLAHAEPAAPTPAAHGIELPVPVAHATHAPAADAMEPPEPAVPVAHATPIPAADATEVPVPMAHDTPIPAADATEPRQPVLVEDPAGADATERRRPTPPPQVAQPREARRLGFFGPVRFR